MRKYLLVLFALAAALAVTPVASADSIAYSFVASGVTATGTFDLTWISGGLYNVTGGTMTVVSSNGFDNGTSTTLAPLNTDGSDNRINASSPFIDLSGISFIFGGDYVNLYYGDPGGPWGIQEAALGIPGYAGNPNGGVDAPGVLSMGAVVAPEPSSLLLLGSGLLGLAFIVFRKAKTADLTPNT